LAENQEPDQSNRAAVYIDGFNLYYPVNDFGEPFMKWCNLWRLSEIMCAPKGLQLVKVVFCTAMPEHDSERHARHVSFNQAQIACGVTVTKGHYVYDPDHGKYCEKQSDINVALSLILDGIDDVYDWAFLLSADSDQAATARFFKERFQHKKLVAVAPPDRDPPHKSRPYVETSFTLKKEQLEAAIMPAFVPTKAGGFVRRPDAYKPPDWWVHPDNRPAKKAAS
jgi:hypothetical protein